MILFQVHRCEKKGEVTSVIENFTIFPIVDSSKYERYMLLCFSRKSKIKEPLTTKQR